MERKRTSPNVSPNRTPVPRNVSPVVDDQERERDREKRMNPPDWKRELLREIDRLAKRPEALEKFRAHIPGVAESQDREAKKPYPPIPLGQSLSFDEREETRGTKRLIGGGREPALPEKYYLLAAFHDAFRESEDMDPIFPKEWNTAHFALYFQYGVQVDEFLGWPDPESSGPRASRAATSLEPILRRYIEHVKADLASLGRAGPTERRWIMDDAKRDAEKLLEIRDKCMEWRDVVHPKGALSPKAKAAERAVMRLIEGNWALLSCCRTPPGQDTSNSLERAFDWIDKHHNRGPDFVNEVGPTALASCLTAEAVQPGEPTFIVWLGGWARRPEELAALRWATAPVTQPGEPDKIADRLPVLHETALAILQFLDERGTRTKQASIAAKVHQDEGTVRSRLKELRRQGFTEAHGRTGEGITPKGREYLKSLPG